MRIGLIAMSGVRVKSAELAALGVTLRERLAPGQHGPEPRLDPPAGDAPAGSLYKSEPQAAAWRQIGWHANASQSPVLPRTRRAYETHVSTGSTAVTMRLAPGWIWRF
jgi:hypothetical protein